MIPEGARIVLVKELGKGRFGNVILARVQAGEDWLMGGALFAVKEISTRADIKSQSDALQLVALNQSENQSQLDHPNIVRCFGSVSSKSKISIVMEYCDQGKLEQFMLKERPSLEQCVEYFRKIAEAVSYCRRKNIYNRDIKPDNILFHLGQPKLADFGTSVKRLHEVFYTFCGTPIFSAPQVLLGKEYGSRAEVWSLGLLLYYMLHFDYEAGSPKERLMNSLPWYSSSFKLLIDQIHNKPLEIDQRVPPRIKAVITQMLQIDPALRIDLYQLVQIINTPAAPVIVKQPQIDQQLYFDIAMAIERQPPGELRYFRDIHQLLADYLMVSQLRKAGLEQDSECRSEEELQLAIREEAQNYLKVGGPAEVISMLQQLVI